MSGCGEVSDFGAGQAHRREVIGLRAREPSPRIAVRGLFPCTWPLPFSPLISVANPPRPSHTTVTVSQRPRS